MPVVKLERFRAHLLGLIGHLLKGVGHTVERRVDAAAEENTVRVGLRHRVLGRDRCEPVLVPIEDRYDLGHGHVGEPALKDEVVDLV